MTTLRLPVGPVARLLLGLCRRGPAPEPTRVADGWAHYAWEGLDGGVGHVAIRTPDHPDHGPDDDEALEALRRAPVEDRSYAELAVILARLLELDGLEGQWRWQRVGEVLYGRHCHPERHNPALRGWLALLRRGAWDLGLGPPERTARARKAGRSRTSPRTPRPKARPLLDVERSTRSSATVRLDSVFSAALGTRTVELPAHAARLSQPDHKNPQGNLPTRATRARARLAAAVASTTRPGPQPAGREDDASLRLHELLERYGGVDLEPVARRRHVAEWAYALLTDLKDAFVAIGVGLAQLPSVARRVTDTAIRLTWRTARPHGPAPPAPGGRPLAPAAPRPG